jgi:predicted MFS family arabinose efflux permease
MAVFANVVAWFPLRLMLGASQSLMWTTGETWVNHASDDKSRGRTVSIFISGIAAGFASGPFLQAEVGSEGWLPFLVGAALIAIIALPLFAGMGDRISGADRPSARLWQYVRLAPVPMFSNLAFAMVASSLMTLLVVYGLRLEMEEGPASRLIGWMGWGGVLMPLAIGYLADRMNRTLLLAIFVGLGALATVAMPYVVDMGVALSAVYMMVFGGMRAGHYGLGVMLLGERFRGADLPSATAVFGFMFGIGSFMGPAISGVAIDLWDPHGLPLVVALFYLVYLPVPLIAYLRRGRLPARSAPTP